MPTLVPSEIRCRSRRMRDFGGIYGATVLLSFHWALVIYVNSTYLEQFFSHYMVSALYSFASAVSIFFFLAISKIIQKVGNLNFIIYATIIEAVTLFFFPFIASPPLIALLFVIHQTVIPLILFSLDIFMESMIGECEGETGGRRGLFLTMMSLTIALSALVSGYLIGDSEPQYELVYIASTLLLAPFLLTVVSSFARFHDGAYDVSKLNGVRQFWQKRDIRNVFCAHFLLQLFFAWMVIYTPIYLNSVIGFNWEEIGQILFVGLMAYVLFEYVIGVVADKWIGEKEMMAAGFFITAVSTSWFAFLQDANIVYWMIAMFMTRVGASLIETTTESYFFKHTSSEDTALISFFRMTRPLSYLIGALLGSITLFLFPINLIFVILGLLLIPGLFFAAALHDTK